MTDAAFNALVTESRASMRRAIRKCNRERDFQSYARWEVSLDRKVWR